MYVVVGEKIFDPDKDKIMIIFNPGDVKNIKIMDNDGENCYAVTPKGCDTGEVNRWMLRKAKDLNNHLSKN